MTIPLRLDKWLSSILQPHFYSNIVNKRKLEKEKGQRRTSQGSVNHFGD